MKNNGIGDRILGPLLCGAVLVSAGGGLGFRLASAGTVQALAAISSIMLGAMFGIFWYARACRERRWRAALDAYAERQISRERNNAARSTQAVSRGAS